LDYSFSKLSEKARKHLPFLGLFCERVDVNLLDVFSKDPDDEYGQAYQAVFGENLQKDDWLAILNEAAAASILQQLNKRIYQIHPALPWFLRKRLNIASLHNEEVISELEKKLLIFYAYLANYYREKLINNAELATFILRVEEANLLQNLHFAEQQQQWAYAQCILEALGDIYERLGRKPEFKALRQSVLNQIGIHLIQAKAKGKDAFHFWMYLRINQANEALLYGDLEAAREINQELLDESMGLNDSSVNYKIASAYQNLGIVAQEKRQFEQARQYYLKALKIKEDAGDLYNAASVYHELGIVAQEQQQFEQAQQYYLKALKIFEDAGDLYSAASVYHELGIIAEEQQQFEQARQYYLKALKIKEDAGVLYSAASDYQQLGMVAQEKRQFEQAISYYQKTFGIYEQFQDWYKASLTLGKWGRVLEAQSNFSEALPIYIRGFVIDFEHHQEFIRLYINALARMLRVLGENQFDTIWREVTEGDCAGEVREAILAARDRLDEEG
jgi:tetratricopeptide (TPR) repeat protein